MRRLIGICLPVLLALTLLFSNSARADFYDGLRAFDAGDVRGAAKLWRAAADEGDAKSQLRLGQMYRDGDGVPQDFVRAHLWFNLANAAGKAEAGALRDALSRRMTRDQMAEAQRLASAWKPIAGAGRLAAAGTKPGIAPGLWIGSGEGNGSVCYHWPFDLEIEVSGSNIAGVIKSSSFVWALSGSIDDKGNANAYGNADHTGMIVMFEPKGDTLEALFGADAEDCSGRIVLRKLAN